MNYYDMYWEAVGEINEICVDPWILLESFINEF